MAAKKRRKARTTFLSVIAALKLGKWPVFDGKKLTHEQFVEAFLRTAEMRALAKIIIASRFNVKTMKVRKER